MFFEHSNRPSKAESILLDERASLIHVFCRISRLLRPLYPSSPVTSTLWRMLRGMAAPTLSPCKSQTYAGLTCKVDKVYQVRRSAVGGQDIHVFP